MGQALCGHALMVYKQFLKNVILQAIYTHCANHRLNLIKVDVAKDVEEAGSFFTL